MVVAEELLAYCREECNSPQAYRNQSPATRLVNASASGLQVITYR